MRGYLGMFGISPFVAIVFFLRELRLYTTGATNRT